MTARIFRYSCDCGSLAIGSPSCVTLVPNGFGDGSFRVFVCDREDFESISERFVHMSVCQGEAIIVYDYDCESAEPLCVLSGRFGIYRSSDGGDMALVRWGDSGPAPEDFAASVRKCGNSLAITIPAQTAKTLGISEGDTVQAEIRKCR